MPPGVRTTPALRPPDVSEVRKGHMLPTDSATGLEVDCLAFDMEVCAIQIRSLSFKQWRALRDARDSTCPQHRTLVDTGPANGLLLPLLVPVANHMGKTCPPDRSRRPETTTMFHVKPLHHRSIDALPLPCARRAAASNPGRADSPTVSQCTGNRRHTAVSQRPIADVEPGPPSCDRQCDCHRVHGRAALQASKSHRTLLPTPSAGGPHDRMRAH